MRQSGRRHAPVRQAASRQARGSRNSDPPESSVRLLGHHSVREALRAGRRELFALLIRAGARGSSEIDSLIELARERGVPSRELDAEELARGLADTDRVPSVALDAGPLPESPLLELTRGVPGNRRLVALDGVEDPQNLGAIARVAEAAGVDGLVLTQRRSPPLGAATSRASAGAIEWLRVARVPNLPRALEQLKAAGFWVVGADLSAGDSLFEVPDRILRGDLVVALGSEGKGLRPVVQALVDHPVRIPMQGRVSSLNVATAGAVILFDLLRRAPVESRSD